MQRYPVEQRPEHSYVIPSNRDRDRPERRPPKCGKRYPSRRGPSTRLRMTPGDACLALAKLIALNPYLIANSSRKMNATVIDRRYK